MGPFIILLLGGVVGFVLGFAVVIPDLKKIIRILRTPIYSGNTIPDGNIVEVTGQIRSEFRSLHSPLTRTDCVLWQVEVQEYVSGGESGSWNTIFKETSVHPFDVSNGSTTLKVYPADAELILHMDFFKESEPFIQAFEPTLQSAVDKLLSSLAFRRDSTRPLKLFEQTVKVDEPIFILGRIQQKNGIRLISSSRDDSPFLISDRHPFILLVGLYIRVSVSIFLLTVLGMFLARYVASPT